MWAMTPPPWTCSASALRSHRSPRFNIDVWEDKTSKAHFEADRQLRPTERAPDGTSGRRSVSKCALLVLSSQLAVADGRARRLPLLAPSRAVVEEDIVVSVSADRTARACRISSGACLSARAAVRRVTDITGRRISSCTPRRHRQCLRRRRWRPSTSRGAPLRCR